MKLNVKLNFDDRKIREAARNGSVQALRSAAAYIYKVARNSIRRRANPDKASLPGTPPYTHSKGIVDFKKSIVFSVDEKNMTALIGPVYIKGGLGNVARLHEFGGDKSQTLENRKKLQRVEIGEYGPIRVKSRNEGLALRSVQHRHAIGRNRWLTNDPLTGDPVVFVKIRTQTQADASTRLRNRLRYQSGGRRPYSASMGIITRSHYPARPFMGPALRKSQERIAPMWRNAIISN